MEEFRQKIHPGLRGAFFYSAYWGVVGLYEPFMNIYFLRLGLTGTQIGWLAAVLPLCVMLVTPLVTRMADSRNSRVVFLAAALLGYGLTLTILGLPGLKPSFPMLVGIIALISVFRSPITSLADSVVAPMAVRYQLDFGAMRLWGSIIFTITASAFGLVWERTGFTAMFLIAAVGLLPVAFSALLLEEQTRRALVNPPPAAPESPLAGAPPAAAQAPTRALPEVDRGLWFLLGGTFLVIAALFMGSNFGSVYMIQLGGSPMMVGMVLGIAAMGEVPGMLYGNRLARRLGATNTLILAYALNALGLIGYALVQSPWALLVFSGVRGLGFGAMLVGNVTIINQYAPKEFSSTFQGVFNAACYGLAPLIGGPVSGWIYQHFGPPALFFTTAAMTLTAGLLILPTYRIWRHRPAAEVGV